MKNDYENFINMIKNSENTKYELTNQDSYLIVKYEKNCFYFDKNNNNKFLVCINMA